MRTTIKAGATIAIAAIALSLAMPALAGAAAKLKADYRFEGNFKSSAGTVPNLKKVGPGGAFVEQRVKGSREGVWKWPEGTGLRLEQAGKAFGSTPDRYTVVMLVNLDDVDGFRKLIDFNNLQSDAGLYVEDGRLYPYSLDYSGMLVKPGRWHQIAITRGRKGTVNGFIDTDRVVSAKDPAKDLVMGADKILHFLIDDSGGTEQSGGRIARLRIYDDALGPRKVKALRK